MKTIPMPEITTTDRGQTLVCRGGWEAFVPEVRPDRETLWQYTQYWSDEFPGQLEKAELRAIEAVQHAFELGFLAALKNSIRHWMRLYARKWPSHVASDGTLRGFRPEIMQRAYMPSENTGRQGKRFARKMLQEMAFEASETADV